jgi:hypothetical protein
MSGGRLGSRIGTQSIVEPLQVRLQFASLELFPCEPGAHPAEPLEAANAIWRPEGTVVVAAATKARVKAENNNNINALSTYRDNISYYLYL